jgi:hypothetical protein
MREEISSRIVRYGFHRFPGFKSLSVASAAGAEEAGF